MDCITCGFEAGYNRVVVDLMTGAEIGGFCLRCERSEFGRSLTRSHWTSDEECAFCDRDGFFALPLWRPYTTKRGNRIVCSVDYEVTGETLVLCDEHLHELQNYETEPLPSKEARTDTP